MNDTSDKENEVNQTNIKINNNKEEILKLKAKTKVAINNENLMSKQYASLIRASDEVKKIHEARLKEKDKTISCLTTDLDINIHKLNEKERRIIDLEDKFNNLIKYHNECKNLLNKQDSEIKLLKKSISKDKL